jgi:PAS domain S-box-containing protein
MDAVGAAPDRPHAAPDRVLLVLPPGRNRELLAEWLDSLHSYEVLTAAPDGALPEYDLCVVDERGLAATRATLRERKAAADPLHLPHLLLRPGDGATEAADHADVDWGLVDDAMGLPVEQAALRRRVENLLQARRASLRLREREEQYQQLVELTPEGIVLVEDGRLLYANTAAVDLLGAASSAAVEGDRLDAYVADADRQTLAETLAAVEESGTTPYTEITVERGGRTTPTSVAGVAVTYDGRPVTQLVLRDLSQQKARERRLDLFGRAIESAAQGITIADAGQSDEPLVYANAAFERITGYGVEEVLGRNCRFLQGERTDDAAVARLRRAIDREEPVSVELLNYHKDGTPFWNALDIVPVEGEGGTVTHYLGLQRDVTARKQREQRVAVLDRVLRHNLRNRTNVIRGYADLIGDVPPEQARAEITEAADELLAISEQVRAFRSVVDGEPAETTTVDVAAVVRDAVEGFENSHPGGRVTAETPETATIRATETLPAAIRDLVELAGLTDTPEIEVAVRETAADVLVELTDRGGAVDVEDLRVVGGDLETPLEHLRGVDLWLVRWSVEQSGGEFIVDEDDGDPLVRMRFHPA